MVWISQMRRTVSFYLFNFSLEERLQRGPYFSSSIQASRPSSDSSATSSSHFSSKPDSPLPQRRKPFGTRPLPHAPALDNSLNVSVLTFYLHLLRHAKARGIRILLYLRRIDQNSDPMLRLCGNDP